jgi:hypothetical protein
MSKFDSMELAVDQPTRLKLRHPITREPLRTVDGKEAWLDLLSNESRAAREYDDRVIDRYLKRKTDGDLRAEGTAAENREEQSGRLAALTTGWFLVGLSGAALDVPFSPQNAAELYGSPGMTWVRDQAQAHIASRANFMKPPSDS